MHLNCIVAENTTNPNLTAATVVQFKAVPWQFTTLIPDLDFGGKTLWRPTIYLFVWVHVNYFVVVP